MPADLVAQMRACAPGLADGVAFSHVTAARWWRLPLPSDLEQLDGLDVMTRSGSGQPLRRGLRGHRGVESRAVVRDGSVVLVEVADTWCDLGDLGRRRLGVEDLVVAGDAAVTRIDEAAGVTRAESVGRQVLAETLRRRVRPRGAVALRQALLLVRPGVRSAQESRTRVVFHEAGLPEPEVNAVIADRAGCWLAEGDLVWRQQRVVAEYQGEVHADRRRRSADASRRGLLVDEGWSVHEVWAEDLASWGRRAALVLRVRRSLGL
ncbi:hypothetical protein [Arthrobacter sp. NEB 688]|uniref:hypothetical protein n=1 Tax=Arthrobacter sp. NEB 688 TaxID=904039 RepID=UPI001566DC22|nr:hypothetical protein [Arthrobacter sp. NEB 688]QKE83861.1 hypothetical protein HL663_07850 [Arthrobacter sp. NEB 688]